MSAQKTFRPLRKPARRNDPAPILQACADRWKVDVAQFAEKNRTEHLSDARHVAMYLLREHCGLSFPAIGKLFKRDHGSILHGCRRVAALRKIEPWLNEEIVRLETELFTT